MVWFGSGLIPEPITHLGGWSAPITQVLALEQGNRVSPSKPPELGVGEGDSLRKWNVTK